MKCSRCGQPVTEFQWQTRGEDGVRHLQCPKKNSEKNKRRRRQIERYRREMARK